MVVKTQHRKKQFNKHSKKYTSTKKTVSRRTRKNDLVLRGGGEDVEIYYKKNFFNKIIGSTSPNEAIKEIQYKKLSKMPEIKIHKNGIYQIKFFYKDYQTQNTVSNPGTNFGLFELERSGTLTHTTKTISESTGGLKKIQDNYANEQIQKSLTITVQISTGSFNKTKKIREYSSPYLTYYFNLKPTV